MTRRFAEHKGEGGKGAKYTASRRPIRYEAAWELPDRAHASKLEYRLKTLTKSDKELLIRGGTPPNLDPLPYTRV